MKKIILILTVLLSVNFGISSQTVTDSIKRNSVYIELLGNSLIYSLNYDYLFDLSTNAKLAVGVGTSYLYLKGENGGHILNPNGEIVGGVTSYINNHNLLLTPEVNFLIGNSSNHYFETGISICNHILITTDLEYNIAPALRIGYRYQPLKGGFLFRIGFTPVYSNNKIYPFGGLSFGYSF